MNLSTNTSGLMKKLANADPTNDTLDRLTARFRCALPTRVDRMNDRDVVTAFVCHLSNHGHPGLKVERWPEDQNRRSKDVDAIAGPFAIEHTSIDSVPNQRRDDNWYMRVIGGLTQELSGSVDFRLSIILKYTAVEKGQNWAALRADLRSWVVDNASRLNYGSCELDLPTNPSLRVRVIKSRLGRHGVYFRRFEAPPETPFSERIKGILDGKGAKLAKYQGPGTTTVLLVENGDIAQMSDGKMLDGIRKAYPTACRPVRTNSGSLILPHSRVPIFVTLPHTLLGPTVDRNLRSG